MAKKKLPASATLTLLMAMTFILCIYFLMDFMDTLCMKIYLERKISQLKIENYIANSLLKHKINIVFPKIIAQYIDNEENIPSEAFLLNQLQKIIGNNPKFKGLSIMIKYENLWPLEEDKLVEQNNSPMRINYLFHIISQSTILIMINNKNIKVLIHRLLLNTIMNYSTKVKVEDL